MPLPELNSDNLGVYLDAVRELRVDTPARWGKMDATRMARHLRHTLEVSYGEREDPDHSNWFTRGIGRVLAFHIFTWWPGGVIKQPDSWTPPPEHEFDEEHNLFMRALERFVEELRKDPSRKTLSPLLGPRTLDYWTHIHSVHFAHHFRQFGL